MPSNLSPREALDRIAALCDRPGMARAIWPDEVRAVLAAVSPEPPRIMLVEGEEELRLRVAAELRAERAEARLVMRRCAWEQCPGLSPDVPMHEAEDGPEWHDICRNAAVGPEAVRELTTLYRSLAEERRAAEVSPEPGGDVRDRYHGHPYEIVIPCMTLEEANAEKADLHAAVEARAFIRPAGVGGVLDRDQARDILRGILPVTNDTMEVVLDRLAGCVRPAAIDRDALAWRVSDVLMRVYDNGTSPNARREAEEVVKAIEEALPALVRPAPAGVTLTPEEAASAAACVRAASRVAYMRDDLDALAARLEAEAAS